MPIRDVNESERACEHGRNMVWRDAARHRYEPTMHIGPKGKAKPYAPRYIAALPEVAQKCLEFSGQLALPSPTDSAIVRKEVNELAVCEPHQHVLPGPLIDLIVSISRLSIPDGQWIDSELRVPWARETMDNGNATLKTGNCHLAATMFARVFGTMLTGFLMSKLTRDEEAVFRASWGSLQEFVDDNFIPELLAATGSHRQAKTLEDMRWHNTIIPSREFNRVGAPELLLAEDIHKLNRAIESLRATAMPTGRDDVAVEPLTFTASKALRLRIVGDVMVFPPSLVGERHKLNRYAVWVIDSTTKKPRLKLWKVRKWMADIISQRETNELWLTWSPTETPQSMGTNDFIIKWMGSTEPRPQEALLMPGANRENVEAYYNGRAYMREQIKDLELERDCLLDRFMKP